MENKNNSHDHLPPGFRFHPTDEELIMFYLRNQATSRPCPVSIIPEVDIYKFDPWQLPEKAEFGEKEWYFFSPRDRKYPNGVRPNRATVSGYWKATGTDKAIHSGSRNVGVKKALVFYKGRPPKGIKTDWIMHEYRLLLSDSTSQPNKPRHNGSMRLDDWVLCRIYKKRPMGGVLVEEQSFGTTTLHDQKNDIMVVTSNHQQDTTIINSNNIPNFDEQNTLKFPRTYSLSHLLEMDYNLGSIKQFLNDNSTFDHFPNDLSNIGVVDHHNHGGNEKSQFVQEMMPSSYYQYADSVKYQVNQDGFSSLNSIYDFQ